MNSRCDICNRESLRKTQRADRSWTYPHIREFVKQIQFYRLQEDVAEAMVFTTEPKASLLTSSWGGVCREEDEEPPGSHVDPVHIRYLAVRVCFQWSPTRDQLKVRKLLVQLPSCCISWLRVLIQHSCLLLIRLRYHNTGVVSLWVPCHLICAVYCKIHISLLSSMLVASSCSVCIVRFEVLTAWDVK
jgi:hypothetical protein